MLDKIKTVAGAILAAVVIGLILTAIMTYMNRSREVKQLRQANEAYVVEIKDLKESAAKDLKSGVITDETRADIGEKTGLIVDGTKKAQDKLTKKEIDVRNDFKKKPVTETTPKQKADALSEVRIMSLWETWCDSTGNTVQADCVGAK